MHAGPKRTYSGGREKSAAIVGKSVAISAGFSEGFSEDRDLRYSLSPASIWSKKSPNVLEVYAKFFALKLMCSVFASLSSN
jgi:hypothetical protein